MQPEEARVRANELLHRAAGKHEYRVPTVLPPEQEQAQRQRMAMMRSKRLQTAPQSADPSHSQRTVNDESVEVREIHIGD